MNKPLAFLAMLATTFTKPAAALFLQIAKGWTLCSTRRTLTNIYRFADNNHTTTAQTIHYFFRDAEWKQNKLWKQQALLLINRLAQNDKTLTLTLDDTTHHKTGRKVDGARTCRDAIRSTRNKTVYCWALQFVPLCLLIHPPWGGEPLSIPVNIRLNRKAIDRKTTTTLLDHAESMIRELAEWFPEKRFRLVVDGAFAPLAGRNLPRTEIISRMRSDAAIFELPPRRRKGQRGRPAIKGKRLSAPKVMATQVRKWQQGETIERGQKRKRLVYVRQVVWARVSKRPVLLVVSRDPEGKEKDDYFFTTDLSLSGLDVVSFFSGRWSVEDTFRNVKQFLGAEEPQSWARLGPERSGLFSYLMYGAVWLERIGREGEAVARLARPWYSHKSSVSFQDALADVRVRLWEERIKDMFASGNDMMKIQKALIEAISWAS